MTRGHKKILVDKPYDVDGCEVLLHEEYPRQYYRVSIYMRFREALELALSLQRSWMRNGDLFDPLLVTRYKFGKYVVARRIEDPMRGPVPDEAEILRFKKGDHAYSIREVA